MRKKNAMQCLLLSYLWCSVVMTLHAMKSSQLKRAEFVRSFFIGVPVQSWALDGEPVRLPQVAAVLAQRLQVAAQGRHGEVIRPLSVEVEHGDTETLC